jgi:lipoprotein-releasing system permease protein
LNIPALFARRYLFAKRSTNAINIITGISVLGIAIGTAALILVLSVFNGFEDLLSGLFGYFNPEIKVTPLKGKTWDMDSIALGRIRALPGVLYASESLEEIAFFEYEGSQDFGMLKGVDSTFAKVNGIDSTIREGIYKFTEEDRNYAVLGAGMRNKLSINVNNPLAAMLIYMPLEKQTAALDKPFKTRIAYPAGTFAIQQEFDNQYILVDLKFARELLGDTTHKVSSLELKCKKGANIAAVKQEIQKIMGDGFILKDRYEQNEAFFKVMKLEKFMGFAIASLMLILMAFNMVGALWMIVLDKQKDISILKSMGADNNTLRNIFLTEGMFLTLMGMLIGFVAGIGIYYGQKTFGWVTIPQGFLVDSYPIALRVSDFLPVILTVLSIGLIASLAPALKAARIPAFLRED